MVKRIIFLIISILLLCMGCAKECEKCNNSPTPSPSPGPQPSPSPLPTEIVLSWEHYPENREWTEYTYALMDKELYESFNKAQDATKFCREYSMLTKPQRIHVWLEMVSQVSYWESAWNYLARYHESTMGTDPVTGQSVYSEGLLSLSYQDTLTYKFCGASGSGIDWQKDKDLPVKSPKKTILQPIINLDCGLRIMARQIAKRGKMILDKSEGGCYWSRLCTGYQAQKIEQITKVTNDVCRKYYYWSMGEL